MDEKTAQALEKAKVLLEPHAEAFTSPEEHRVDAVVKRENLKAAFSALICNGWGYLSTISGFDKPAPAAPAPAEGEAPAEQPEGSIEALYHICEGAAVATLRVTVPYSDAMLPTVCDVYPSATLDEREFMELLGVAFEGTPSTQRLVLPDDWPDGVYPLRKSFTGFGSAATEAAKGEAS